MYPLKQSTAITIPFFVHDVDGDAVTGLGDGDFVKRISKNGGAFGAMTVTITEKEGGWYDLPVGSGHSDTNGVLTMYFTSATIKQANLQFRVSTTGFDDIPTAAENVNEWETQSQADPTGFHVNAMEWLSQTIATPTNNGVPEIDLTHVMGTILTEGAGGRLAAALIKFLDVATPAGTINSLPGADADAAGGLVISDAGGLDIDTKLANTNEITAARMGALTDWIDGGRLDTILDAAATATKLRKFVQLMTRKDAAIATDNATELTAINADGGSGGGTFSNQTDSEEALRDRGDSAWITATGFNTTTPDAAGTAASLHSTTDGKIDAIQTDIGDFSGRTNDQSLLDVLGVPDVAGKDLHTLLVTDRLDNGTFGLSAIRTRGDAEWITATGFNTTTPPTAAAIVNEWETQSQANPTGFHVNVLEVGGTSQTANDNGADINTLLTRITALLPTKAEMDTAHGLLATPAQVNAQVLDVLNVDTFTEPGQGAPPAAPTMRQMMHFNYKQFRNKETQTASQYSLFADDGTTVDQKATISDDATTYTKAELVTGA